MQSAQERFFMLEPQIRSYMELYDRVQTIDSKAYCLMMAKVLVSIVKGDIHD